MLSVPIHKDLTKYQAKIAFGLTMRTLTCIVAAVGTSVFVGAYAWFVLGIPFDSISWAAYAVGLPLWAMAFWTPDHMRAEEWLPLWIRHSFGVTHLVYENHSRYAAAGLVPSSKEVRHVSSSYERYAKHQRALEWWEPGSE